MQYDLDMEALEKQYKRLQWQIHPDRLAAHTPQEQDYSAQSVMHINVAYGVLRHPLSRANYIVS
jgi:molecular chaperone HscB